jgi:hypothetical protein
MNLRTSLLGTIAALALVCGSFNPARGQNLLDSNPASPTFNNPSFELPDVAFVGVQTDKWTLTGPTQLVDFPPFGVVPVIAGCGIFENPAGAGHLDGADGSQIAYIFANTINDVMTSQPVDHAFTQVLPRTLAAGEQYRLTVGVANATAAPPPNSVLTMSLFAFDSANPTVEQLLASTPVSNTNGQLNGVSLTDFSAMTPLIGGAAVGKQIGIRISTHTDPTAASAQGQFDFDNVRLTLVPEPAGAALLAIGAFAAGRRRRVE